jgi:hypothetical protein
MTFIPGKPPQALEIDSAGIEAERLAGISFDEIPKSLPGHVPCEEFFQVLEYCVPESTLACDPSLFASSFLFELRCEFRQPFAETGGVFSGCHDCSQGCLPKEYAKKSVAGDCHRFFYFFSVLIGPAGLGGSFTGFAWSFFINSAIARSS